MNARIGGPELAEAGDVLQAAAGGREPGAPASYEVLLLSAETPGALEAMTDRLAADLAVDARPLRDVALALQRRRPWLDHRRIVVGHAADDVAAALAARDSSRVFTREQRRRRRPVAFLFPGLGDQYAGMARELYDGEPSFRAALDECAALALPELGADLRELLYPPASAAPPPRPSGDPELLPMIRRRRGDALAETRIAQPAVFAVAYAMARCLRDWGIEPHAVLGHSLGEYAAATVAGIFSLPDAVRVVCRRAELIDRLPRGAMLAAAATESDAIRIAREDLEVAAVNGERAVVLTGAVEAIERARARLSASGLACRPMPTTHPFHSRMLAAAQPPLARLLRAMVLRRPAIAMVSNVTGTWLAPGEAVDAAYWATHMCRTVRFADGLQCLLEGTDAALLEVGPGQSLGSFARQHRSCGRERVSSILSTIAPSHLRQSPLAFFREALGKLWLSGVEVDWRAGWREGRRAGQGRARAEAGRD